MTLSPLFGLALCAGLLLSLPSCSSRDEEVIESQYVEPRPPYPSYSFARNNASSVDLLDATELIENYSSLYRMMAGSDFDALSRQQDFQRLYEQGTGVTDIIPQAKVATSPYATAIRPEVLADLDALIESAKAIVRSREGGASQGSGYIGRHRSDANALFADARGVIPSAVFEQYTLGAVMLDLILGVHLDPQLYLDPQLRQDHENLISPHGSNYTALEHHWDLAYGYYSAWRSWAESNGISALKDVERRLSYAFAQGRLDLTELRYPMALEQLQTIHRELSRVVAVRAIHLLVGRLTALNLEDDNLYALRFVSQGIGMLYALQFTKREDGAPHVARTEVVRLVEELIGSEGLWDSTRLLSGEQTSGSLRSVARRVAELYGIDLQQITD